MKNNNPVIQFYNQVSGYYDQMIRFSERLDEERIILRRWSEKYHFSNVLDAGCGSGLYTIMLNQLGVPATGIDISSKMIERAKKNAKQLNVPATFIHTSFADLRHTVRDFFDSILILGNSLVHILNPQELLNVLSQMRERLLPKGCLIIQILNYDKIIREQKRIVSVSQQENNHYIRFYDFGQPLLQFNSLHIKWLNGRSRHSLTSTSHYPYRKNELVKILKKAGYRIDELFGSMKFERFEKNMSTNCVIVAEKTEMIQRNKNVT